MFQLTHHIKELARERNTFIWTTECETEMEKIREVASKTLPLRPFCIQHATRIYMDASHQGLGFSLTQVDNEGHEYFVQCGSCTCTPAMLNYSCMELELKAMVFAVKKCATFLMALDSFTIFTDHRDLEGLEARELVPTPNSPFLRNTEYLLSFPLKVQYLPKESNLLADWRSRNPKPAPVSDLIPRFEGTVALVYEGMPLDKLLLDLIEECNRNED